MSSLSRMLSILNLFDSRRAKLTVEEISVLLGISLPTAYRYVRELCKIGLLGRFSGAYLLGARIIEFDHAIRERDPLLAASQPIIQQLQEQSGCHVFLCNIFGERVIMLHLERGMEPLSISFSRGRSLPLFRGVASKAILAHLPVKRIKKVYEAACNDPWFSAQKKSWNSFWSELQEIKQNGFALSTGELDPANMGVAVPVFYDDTNPPACLGLLMGRARYDMSDKEIMASVLKAAARHIEAALEREKIDATILRVNEPEKDVSKRSTQRNKQKS